jgi:hypothetical protein
MQVESRIENLLKKYKNVIPKIENCTFLIYNYFDYYY